MLAENGLKYGFVKNVKLTDVDGDNELERKVKFPRKSLAEHIQKFENIGKNKESVELTVVGRLSNGVMFADLDGTVITVMRPGKKGNGDSKGPPQKGKG